MPIFVMLFIRAPVTPPGPCLECKKKRKSLYALGRKGKKRNLLETKYKRHRETVNAVTAKHWEFMVKVFFLNYYSLIGRDSGLKRRSMGQVC